MGKGIYSLNGNWDPPIVLIRGTGVPFSLTIPGFGYKRLFGETMAPREKGAKRLHVARDIWQGGNYDYWSSKRD
jgi:hypothetical protein